VSIEESTWFHIFSKNKWDGVLLSERYALTAAHLESKSNTPIEKNANRFDV
jgi:hypothetical protein